MAMDEAAEALGVPPGTVKSRLHRARGAWPSSCSPTGRHERRDHTEHEELARRLAEQGPAPAPPDLADDVMRRVRAEPRPPQRTWLRPVALWQRRCAAGGRVAALARIGGSACQLGQQRRRPGGGSTAGRAAASAPGAPDVDTQAAGGRRAGRQAATLSALPSPGSGARRRAARPAGARRASALSCRRGPQPKPAGAPGLRRAGPPRRRVGTARAYLPLTMSR